MSIILYQLSRQQCMPCQVLKSKIDKLETKDFEYKYIDVDNNIIPGSTEDQILKEARTKGLRSLPILGLSLFEDNVEDLVAVGHIRYEQLDGFLDIIRKKE